MTWNMILRPTVYIIFWLISIVWVFFLGFMLGQNETPEVAMPFLQTMLPQHEEFKNKGAIPVAENELTYSDILKKEGDSLVIPNEPNVIEKKKAPVSQNLPHTATIIQNANQNQEQIYKFSLQILAVKQKSGAEQYRTKLQEQGIQTELVSTSKNNISWYRVYTTFEGTVKELNTFKDKLASFGIVDTILRERIAQ